MAPTPGPIQNAVVGQIVTESSNFLIPPRKNTTVSNKGLLNMPGQNNCFLNSAVQVLWHLDAFRRSFRDLSGHSCMAESCIFCALKELFTQFQYSQESALPPDALRHALAKTFCDQRRFQLGFMDDAAECFENILLRIHVHIADQDTEDMCGNVNCIPHRKFAMTLVEQRLCQNCSAASEPLPFHQMVHYVTTSALCSKALEMQDQDPNYLLSFGKLLRLAGEMGEARECPSGCGEKVQAYKTLMNLPDVVSIGLVWDSECPTLQHIMDVLQNIGMYLRLQEMFHNVCDYQRANANVHQLVGIVTYYGKHYSTFFFHTKLGIWIYFDDATVQEIGPSWNLVVEKCQRGRFQPLLLLFANLNSSPSTANRDNLNNVTYANCGINQVGNQRQSIINQYLKLQNSQSATRGYGQMKMTNSYHDTQGLYRYHPANSPSTKYAHDIFTYNQNRTLPVYSNLQYLEPPATKLSESELSTRKDFDGAKDSDSAFTEDDRDVSDLYISRRAVENVLQQQKRHMSRQSYSQVGNRNSSSSLESFDTAQQINKVGGAAPLESNPLARRDSGSWSGDRASSSSNNSVENPFLAVVASKRLLLGLNKKSLPDSNSSDHGYDSFSVSSSDSYPSINGSPVKVEPRLTQIPEDWLPEEEDLNEKLKMVTADNSSAPDCDKLCAEADLLLAKSYDKEKDGDIVMAALLCDSAAARARAAMEAPYNNSRSLVSAKMKHSTCVLRSSNLYRRLKDHEMDERRKQKNHTGHHSRQSSRDSTHARHSRQNSKDSTHSKTSGSKDNTDEVDHFGKNIEIYGTLPKKGGRKKNTSLSTLKNKDDAVYRNFLEMQRKNTNLSNELNETMLKNVDLPSKCKMESSPKRKNNVEKNKSHKEIVPPKSPVKKKETPKSDTETKKKQQKPQTSPNNTPNERKSEVEFTCRDLLSPIPAPDRKPHKIKRKLMGNFMKRKNRSLPDLREDPTSTDPMDCFLDDAVIQAPSMILPNGKSRKPSMPANGTFASVNRGFHQPHHAFIKKDLTQRPLLMKVNPPNIQTPDMNNSETKTTNALPAIPKRTSELSSKMDAMNNKPSRIPFITKSDSSLPTFPANKSVIDPKLSPCRPALPKPSAIPVLTPQVSLSPINPQENSVARFGQTTLPEACSAMNDKEDLPPPTNPFLAEIQAKRKQVLNKPTQKQEPLKHIVTENKELSVLPKLALQAEGTSWLKELQSKQQKIINKQVVDLSKQGDLNEKSTVSTDCNGIENIRSRAMELKNGCILNRKLHSEVSSDAVRCPNSVPMNDVTTSSTVRNLASRFEKVLKKPNDVASPLTETDSIQNIPTKNVQTTEGCLEKKPESSVPLLHHNLTRSLSNTSIGVTFQLKSALKVKTGVETSETDSKTASFSDAITKTTKPILKTSPNSPTISESPKTSDASISKPPLPNRSILNMEPLRDQKPIQSVLKPSSPPSPTATSFPVTSSSQCRPMQPPDYATALQRLELIRTSNGEGNTQLLDPESCVAKDASKKKSKKKSVTFSDEVVLVACAEYDEINFSSNPLFERVYQQHLESGKGEIPLLSNTYGNMHSFENESQCDDGLTNNIDSDNRSVGSSNSQCDLCHNKPVLPPNNYCTDCEFYLSRFKA